MHKTLVVPPSGKQYHITKADYSAVIVEVGAGIRVLDYGNRPVLESYPEDAICDGAHGAVLAPWPNRVAGGTYRFDENDYQLPITEPATGSAIHGLIRWRSFELLHLHQSAVCLETVLYPMPWYPFTLRMRLYYELTAHGLSVRVEAKNCGTVSCPFALGHHPYLSPGNVPTIDQAWFSSNASAWSGTQRSEANPASPFLEPMLLAGQVYDTTFTMSRPHETAGGYARLLGADGKTVELSMGPEYRYLQVFTGDTLDPHRRRTAIAVEPMTAPPNALQTGQDLLTLQPGEMLTTEWGVQLQ